MYPHKGAFPSMGAAAPANMPIVGDGNQWMSQSAYQNIDLDKVDWAVLAQQWIHMKETVGGTEEPSIPCAPPPPRFSNTISTSNDYEEQGEAPMEVEHEDEQTPNESIVNVTTPPPPTNIFQTSSSNNWNSETNSNSRGQSHQKHWNRKGNRWGSSKSPRIPGDGYAASGQVFNNAKQMGNAWSSSTSTSSSSNMPPFMHTNAHSNEQMKMHGMDANSKSGIQLEQIGLNATPTLDAAQRKTLPAWIRDGLEKMEREKLKQAERDREMKERDEKRRQEKLIEQNLLMQLNANESSPKLPAKSKFESDSESDNDDTVNSDFSENMPRKSKTMVTGEERTTVGSSANASSSDSTTVPTTFKPHRTKAEILTEIMLSVRKNLTEILLEVTNEEIYAIAQDTLSKLRTKGRKAQSVQKNALTAITPALGLVVYDDSDASKSSDESDSDSERVNEQNTSEHDSDIEIKRAIQRRKATFENKSEEIESYLADIEEREKQWLERDDAVEDLKSSNNQLPVSIAINLPKSNENPDMQRNSQKMPNASKSERKNSRFSDVKSLVYNVANSQMANAAATKQNTRSDSRSLIVDSKKHESDKKDVNSDDSSSRKRSKHSSSTSSKLSHHRSKRDRSRSLSSSRRHKKSSRRRSSSNSSDRSSYSHHSGRSRKHSRRERSSSDDRTSKSSQGSHKRDKYSREKSYSRSTHSYNRSRR